jgi:hypothetical protein
MRRTGRIGRKIICATGEGLEWGTPGYHQNKEIHPPEKVVDNIGVVSDYVKPIL